MLTAYTPRELARAAGFTVRSTKEGGLVVRDLGYARVLEVGPAATDEQITRAALRYLRVPVGVRPSEIAPSAETSTIA